MLLPTSLESTTLGDVLGRLHRAGIWGALQLWAGSERAHEIELVDGWVDRVVVDDPRTHLGEVLHRSSTGDVRLEGALQRARLRSTDPRPLGERLVAVGVISSGDLALALRHLHYERLERLFHLTRARLAFRPLRRIPARGYRLGPTDFLHGRRRFRDVGARQAAFSTLESNAVRGAYGALGLPCGASLPEIRRAYRQAVGRWHPDKFAAADPNSAQRAQRHFVAISESYALLLRHHQGEP